MINVLRQALQGEDLTLLVQDENLRYIFVHQPHALWPEDRILGYTDAEIGITAEQFTKYVPLKQHVLQTGETIHDADWRPAPGGTLIYTEATYQPIDLPSGKRGVLIKLRDLTNVKLAEEKAAALAQELQRTNEELSLNEKRYRVALEDGQTTLMLQDADLNWIWMHNMPPIWQHWIDTGAGYDKGVPFGTYTQLVTNKMRAAREQVEIRTEDWFEHPDGEAAFYQCRFMPYSLSDGSPGVLTKIVNLTEMKVKEERLAEVSQNLESDKRRLSQVLTQLKEEHNRKLEELKAASILQKSLAPKHITLPAGFDIAACMETSDEVGGDYYDFVTCNDGTLVLALGDATGHGLRAGIIMAMVKSYFQLLAPTTTLVQILRQISDGLKGMNLRQAYMGLQLFSISPEGECNLVSAGMPSVLIYRGATATVEVLTMKSLYLGTHLPFVPTLHTFTLNSGDLMLGATDGLTETRNAAGQLLGNAPVVEMLRMQAKAGPAAVIESLIDLGKRWRQPVPLEDDTTLIALMRK